MPADRAHGRNTGGDILRSRGASHVRGGETSPKQGQGNRGCFRGYRTKVLELHIVLDDTNLWVRGLANFLELTDRFYGRSDPRGLRSYAHRRDDQIEIAEVRRGSIELVLSEIVAHTDKVAPIFVLYLLLKYLPEFLKSIVSVYKDFEEAKYTKVRREQLEKQMEEDEETQNLAETQRKELVEVLDNIYVAEREALRKTEDFVLSRYRKIKMLSSKGSRKSG